MFFCDACAENNQWPISLAQSYGACEICKRQDLCNDIPSKNLPLPDRDQDVLNAIASIKDTIKKKEA